ncbi:MAG: hypothetical protein JXB88_12140 [Spirochaetales bacterium]|nr:hypothetical protein [Spirochaetales bacterium]
MSNITLSVDDEIIKKVKKIAIDKNTTLTAMVREYLKSIAERDQIEKEQAVKKLDTYFQKYSRNMNIKEWNRESLHER